MPRNLLRAVALAAVLALTGCPAGQSPKHPPIPREEVGCEGLSCLTAPGGGTIKFTVPTEDVAGRLPGGRDASGTGTTTDPGVPTSQDSGAIGFDFGL